MNDVTDAVKPSFDNSIGFTSSDLESRIANKGKNLDSGERILRFSPTISVKYFDKDKFQPSTQDNRRVVSTVPMGSRSLPSQLKTRLIDEDTKSDSYIMDNKFIVNQSSTNTKNDLIINDVINKSNETISPFQQYNDNTNNNNNTTKNNKDHEDDHESSNDEDDHNNNNEDIDSNHNSD